MRRAHRRAVFRLDAETPKHIKQSHRPKIGPKQTNKQTNMRCYFRLRNVDSSASPRERLTARTPSESGENSQTHQRWRHEPTCTLPQSTALPLGWWFYTVFASCAEPPAAAGRWTSAQIHQVAQQHRKTRFTPTRFGVQLREGPGPNPLVRSQDGRSDWMNAAEQSPERLGTSCWSGLKTSMILPVSAPDQGDVLLPSGP